MIPDTEISKPWRLKDTEIKMIAIKEGEREGEHLFSRRTVNRLPEFYNRVKHLPYLAGTTKGAAYKQDWHIERLPDSLKERTLGFANWQWLGLFLSIFIGLILKTIVEFFIKAIKQLTNHNKQGIRHQSILALEQPGGLIVATAFWYSTVHLLKFDGVTLRVLLITIQIVFSLSLIWAAYRLTHVIEEFLGRIANRTESTLDDELVPMAGKTLRLFVIVVGTLLAAQNLGFNVMSLLAGLGLGGLAFALAAKDTAANLFGSIMILIDRPFRVGDWIKTGGVEGTVEEIGFRSTRVRTFYSSLISVPNASLVNEHIDNIGRRKARRVFEVLGITYDTKPEKIEAFIEGIKNIIKANKYTKKDVFHVVFKGYGDFSLNIMVYFFLDVADWAEELVQKQNVLLEIYRLAESLEIDFAFPTQSLIVEGTPTHPKPLPKELTRDQLTSIPKDFGQNGSQSKPSGLGIFKPPHREV